MNSLILFLSHLVWIVLAVGVIAHGFRGALRDLQSYLAARHPYSRPVAAVRENRLSMPAGSFIFS